MSDDDDNGHSTLPAPHPATPEWAVEHYNTMMKIHQELVMARRRDEARMLEIGAELADHDIRLSRLENEYRGDEPTNPGE